MKKKLKRKLQRSRQAQALRDSPVYSGPRSFEFWSLVNSVRGDLQEEMYAQGVELQEMELSVLRNLSVLHYAPDISEVNSNEY